MTYLLEEELTSVGIDTKTTLKIHFNNKVYVRVKTLPMKFYEQAKKLKEDYTAKKLDSLLIKHKTWIAIWVEELTKLDKIDNGYRDKAKDVSSGLTYTNYQSKNIEEICYLDDEDSLVLPKSSPKTSGKKYRGVEYNDESSHISSDTILQEKSAKKYRGITYQKKQQSNYDRNINKSKQTTRKYRGSSY